MVLCLSLAREHLTSFLHYINLPSLLAKCLTIKPYEGRQDDDDEEEQEQGDKHEGNKFSARNIASPYRTR